MYRKETFRKTEGTCWFCNGKYCPRLISHFTEIYSELYNTQSIASGEQTYGSFIKDSRIQVEKSD